MTGAASYALYLLHPIVIPLTGKLVACFHFAPTFLTGIVTAALALASSITLALLVHIRIERPLTRLLRPHRSLVDRREDRWLQ